MKFGFSSHAEQSSIDFATINTLRDDFDSCVIECAKRIGNLNVNNVVHAVNANFSGRSVYVSQSAVLVYTLWKLFESTKCGIAIFTTALLPADSNYTAWESLRTEYRAILTSLEGLMIDGSQVTEQSMQLYIPESHPYKSLLQSSGKTSLDKLFSLTQEIFPEACKNGKDAAQNAKTNVSSVENKSVSPSFAEAQVALFGNSFAQSSAGIDDAQRAQIVSRLTSASQNTNNK